MGLPSATTGVGGAWRDDGSAIGEGAVMKEICPRGNNKVVIYISLYHDKCLLFMLELY